MGENEPRRMVFGRILPFLPAAPAARAHSPSSARLRRASHAVQQWSRRGADTEGLVATRAKACPTCGAQASDLEWQHVSVREWSGVAWSGWTSFCRRCDRQVDGFEDGFLIA